MTVQVVDTPKAINPAYNQNRFLVTADTSDFSGKYKVRFTLSGTLKSEPSEPFTETFNMRVYPILDGPASLYRGFFDISSFLRNSTLLRSNPIIFAEIAIGYEYATTPTGSLTQVPVSTTNYQVINGALNVAEYRDFDPTYFIDTITSGNVPYKVLTDYQGTRETLRITDHELLFGGLGAGYIGEIKFYNQNTYLTSAEGLVANPNKSWSKLFITGDIVPLTTTRYDAVIKRTSNGLPVSPTYSFDVVEVCRFTPVTVYFTNKYGMQDNFLFKLMSNKSDTINRSKFKRLDRYLDDWQPAEVVSRSTIQRKHNLTTDWVTESQMNTLLSDLAECNYASLYYGSSLSGGTKASFKIVFSSLVNDAFGEYGVQAGWTFSVYTSAGSYTYTAPSFIGDVFYDGAMFALIASISSTTALDGDYDITVGNSSISYAELLFTAKTVGVIYSLSSSSISPSSSASEAAGSFTSIVAGTNAEEATLISVTPSTSEFRFRKKENEDLFLLECEMVETNTFTRQTL